MSVHEKSWHSDLLDAYLKFKSFVYYENFSVCLKIDLANFERNFDTNFNALVEGVRKVREENDYSYINSLVSRISFHLLPKKFKGQEYDPYGGAYYTNRNTDNEYLINDSKHIIPFIDCPIELHILSTYWVVVIGSTYESNLLDCCYANRLYHDLGSQKLFKRYFHEYNKWRDRALHKARTLHKENKNVAILSLDIQSYYHSIDLDLHKFPVSKNLKWLNSILIKIHEKYIEKLDRSEVLNPAKKILPIGLVSSSILSNFYLRDFDLAISQSVIPEFYGRYVDDFLFVFEDPLIIENDEDVVSSFIENNIILKKRKGDLAYLEKGDDKSFILATHGNKLKLQLSKVKLFYFRSDDNISLLNEFENEIKKNSSEFRLQIEEEELNNPFEGTIFQINYSDTINKFRSVEGLATNKFGASKQLSKIITSTRYLDNEEEIVKKISDNIQDYFQGKRSIELYTLWEKVFTYFIVNEDNPGLLKFSRQIINAISRVRIEIPELSSKRNTVLTYYLNAGLVGYLVNSYASAAALNINFFESTIIEGIKEDSQKEDVDKILNKIDIESLRNASSNIIYSNLFKHHFCFYPLVNYCIQTADYSFSSKTFNSQTSFELDAQKIRLSPRFINIHEVELFNFLKSCLYKRQDILEYFEDRNKYNREIYRLLNNSNIDGHNQMEKVLMVMNNDFAIIKIEDDTHYDKLKVGIANFPITEQNYRSSLQGTPNLSLKRLNSINKTLNEAVRNKVNLVIFPEISIPFQWLPKLADYSKKNNIGIICGLEHMCFNNEAHNYVCTILPFREGRYKNSHVDLRLKIDYSPKEVMTLKNDFNLTIPEQCRSEKMRIYHWRGIAFSIFNCFEITDIQKRHALRGKVDMVVAVEYNMDTEYFSNINESLARDIHAYAIQVNSSGFGDSRITLPASSLHKNYIRIKGGENVALLVGDINIRSLREYQELTSEQQLNNKSFKHTPPNYVKSEERKVVANK